MVELRGWYCVCVCGKGRRRVSFVMGFGFR
jgi:hypothetical protein